MKLVAVLSTLSAVSALGTLLASPATADPSAVGVYTFEAEDGETATWNVTACPGDPPGCVRVFESGNPKRASWNGEAHYSVGSWILLVQQSDAILCEDGSTAPGRNTYSWDNSTMSGNVSIFSRGACGTEPKSLSIPFRLSRTGSGPMPNPVPDPVPNPVPNPAAPPDAQPYLPPTPEVAPAAPVAPLPAESGAGG